MPVGDRFRAPLATLALLAAASAHADYKDTYAHGLRAYEDGKYDEARSLMQQALDEHSEPAARVRLYGQVYKPYLPQHYVGMAAFKLGDCETALKQWNDAQNKGVLPIVPEAEAEEQQARPACESKVVAKKEEKAPPPPPATDTAKPPVTDAGKSTTVAKNTPPPVVATPPKPPPAEKQPAEKSPPVVKNEPPQPLMQAFDDYLAGRYVEVARIDPDTYADAHARFHAYLVRAAAKYTLSRLAADDQMLNGARADARAARKLDGNAAPDATLFSPGFRAFYGESR